MRTPTQAEVIAAARAEMRPGVSPELAVLIGYSAVVGERLDPEAFDDAAVLLRAERLVADGMRLGEALAAAHEERITWAVEL